MKIVYIAGPFRAPTAWRIEQNIRRAEALALEVARAGAMPLCPHTNTRHFHGELTDEFWLDGTLELMRRCDAVLTVEGWERSNGAIEEVSQAHARDIPVFHSVDDLKGWMDDVGGLL